MGDEKFAAQDGKLVREADGRELPSDLSLGRASYLRTKVRVADGRCFFVNAILLSAARFTGY